MRHDKDMNKGDETMTKHREWDLDKTLAILRDAKPASVGSTVQEDDAKYTGTAVRMFFGYFAMLMVGGMLSMSFIPSISIPHGMSSEMTIGSDQVIQVR